MSLPKLALAGGLLAVTALALKPALRDKPDGVKSEGSTKRHAASLPTSREDVAAEARAFDHFVIQAAQTAREKAQGADLRAWVETLLADHRQSLIALEALTLNEAYWMPVDEIGPPYTDWLDALRRASLQDFDRTFLERVSEAHTRAQDIFTAFTDRHPKGPLSEQLNAGADNRQSHLDRLEALKGLPEPVFDFTK